MTFTDTQHIGFGRRSTAGHGESGLRRVREIHSRPSGAPGHYAVTLSGLERSLMGTIGRPWV